MTVKIVDGKKIKEEISKEIKKEIDNIKLKYKIVPKITTIKVGEDPSSNLYLKLRDIACHNVGIETNRIELPNDTTEEKVLDSINKLNKDVSVHAILIQLPLPSHISQDKMIGAIDPKKDVEGLNPVNMGKTLSGVEDLIPITPFSVLTILEHEKTKLQGKNVLIINHSTHVGKPLAALLLNRNATVSVCHVYTKDLKFYTKNADIIITAAGVKGLIKKEHVKNDAFIVDVAIISEKGGICGDIDFEEVKEIAGTITPVPGGVGPVTVACSLKNILKIFKNSIK